MNPVKSARTVNVGICGLGTVASGTVNILTRNKELIDARSGCNVSIIQIGARRDNPKVDTSSYSVTRDIFDVVNNPAVDIVVELIGGTTIAKDLVLTAIANGKHIVTANKALIAHHGEEIFAAAKAKGVIVAFEAAVAGGIPIIKSIREGLAANNIEWLAGIINGTTNFILTEMRDKGRTFEDVLKEAQELGYAEADPTFDVEGIDAAHKLVILASLAFGIPLDVKKVFTEGITKISTEDVNYAEELGYRIKHLGIARRSAGGIELHVNPTLIPEKRLIANVDGVMSMSLKLTVGGNKQEKVILSPELHISVVGRDENNNNKQGTYVIGILAGEGVPFNSEMVMKDKRALVEACSIPQLIRALDKALAILKAKETQLGYDAIWSIGK